MATFKEIQDLYKQKIPLNSVFKKGEIDFLANNGSSWEPNLLEMCMARLPFSYFHQNLESKELAQVFDAELPGSFARRNLITAVKYVAQGDETIKSLFPDKLKLTERLFYQWSFFSSPPQNKFEKSLKVLLPEDSWEDLTRKMFRRILSRKIDYDWNYGILQAVSYHEPNVVNIFLDCISNRKSQFSYLKKEVHEYNPFAALDVLYYHLLDKNTVDKIKIITEKELSLMGTEYSRQFLLVEAYRLSKLNPDLLENLMEVPQLKEAKECFLSQKDQPVRENKTLMSIWEEDYAKIYDLLKINFSGNLTDFSLKDLATIKEVIDEWGGIEEIYDGSFPSQLRLQLGIVDILGLSGEKLKKDKWDQAETFISQSIGKDEESNWGWNKKRAEGILSFLEKRRAPSQTFKL